jgi:hypothetical protein
MFFLGSLAYSIWFTFSLIGVGVFGTLSAINTEDAFSINKRLKKLYWIRVLYFLGWSLSLVILLIVAFKWLDLISAQGGN